MRKQALNTFNKLPEILFDILGKAQTESFLAVSDFAIIDRDNFWAENLPPAREISVPDVDMEDASIGMGSAFEQIDGGETIASTTSSITTRGSMRSSKTTRSTTQKLAAKTSEAAEKEEALRKERLKSMALEDEAQTAKNKTTIMENQVAHSTVQLREQEAIAFRERKRATALEKQMADMKLKMEKQFINHEAADACPTVMQITPSKGNGPSRSAPPPSSPSKPKDSGADFTSTEPGSGGGAG